MCLEAYLQGQDLWDIVSGAETEPANIPVNAESRRKWKIKCRKALFVLRTSISRVFIDHVRDVSSPSKCLDKLLTKKNNARLQFLENELAMLNQVHMKIGSWILVVLIMLQGIIHFFLSNDDTMEIEQL